jgi:hypothetical protein
MHNKTLHKLLPILLITLVLSTLVFSQEDEIEIFQEIKDLRTLGEHYFTPNNVLKHPFILTQVKMSLGTGWIEDIRYPLVQIGSQEFLYLKGDILSALLSFEYQHAVKEWLAVYIGYSLRGRLGSDFGTLIKQGVNYAGTIDIGWMIRIHRNEKFALSTSFGVTNGDYSFINLQDFVEDIYNGVPNARLVISNNVLFGRFGIKAAYGFTQFFGLNILADLGYGETIQREFENKWFTTIGINADMNLEEQIKSRTNFILSLDLSMSKELAGKNNETLWLKTTEFSMRYLF